MKAQVLEALHWLNGYPSARVVREVPGIGGYALDALAPCVVLTPEDATAVRMTLVAYAPSVLDPEEAMRLDKILVLLTSEVPA